MQAPKAPDPDKTAAAQSKYDKETAQFNSQLNQVNQQTPIGSLNYRQTGTRPDGTPIYEADTTYTPEVQALLNAGIQTSTGAANAANDLISQYGSKWANGPDLGPSADETGIASAIMGYGHDYLDPIFSQNRSSLETKLMNQGIAPGSDAWNKAIDLDTRGNNEAYTNLLLQGQQTALNADQQNMNRGISAYKLPLDAYAALLGGSQVPSLDLVQTPQAAAQAPDYQGLVQNKYQADLQNYQNKMSGIFGIGRLLAGGLFGLGG